VFAEKQIALEEYVQGHANMSGISLVFENSGSAPAEIYQEFVRFTLQFGDSKRMQIGGNGYRHMGVLLSQIFLREGIGVARGVEIADLISSMFRDKIVGGVNLWVPFVTKVPFSEKGWYQIQVSTPFYFDEVT